MLGLGKTGKVSLDIPYNHLILKVPPQHPTFPSHSRTSSVTDLTASRDYLLYFQIPKILEHSTWWAEPFAFQFWASVSHSSSLLFPKWLQMLKSQCKWWTFRVNSGRNLISILYFSVVTGKRNQHEKHHVWIWRKSNMAFLVLPMHLRAFAGLGKLI